MNDTSSEPLLKTAEVAPSLGLTAKALEGRRKRGVSPPFVMIGPKSVRWRRSEIDAWLAKCARQSPTQGATTNP